MNNSGKALTIFLVVIAVLLIALTAIAVFFFLQEVGLRKDAEFKLEQMEMVESKLQTELKETKNQLLLLEDKNKEADTRIESLRQDVELEKGLNEELKKENVQLQDTLTKENEAKQQMRDQMTKDMAEAEKKITTVQDQLNAALAEKQKLEAVYQATLSKYQKLQQQVGISEDDSGDSEPAQAAPASDPGENSPAPPAAQQQEVNLDTIVVNSPTDSKGKVISIDAETDFVIVSMGEKDGVRKNSLLSVYRGEKLLGDVKVTRALPEMSAADFIPPLTSQDVQKDDRVVIKK